MTWKEIRQLEIDHGEMNRNENELKEFVKKYSKNHVELKLLIPGYIVVDNEENQHLLESMKFIFVLQSEDTKEGLKKILNKINIMDAVVAYVFNCNKIHYYRISAGKGTLFPVSREYSHNEFFMELPMRQIDLISDWKEMTHKIPNYIEYFLKHEEKILPVLWYSKAISSNDEISAFLYCYRCIEKLARDDLHIKNEKIQNIILQDRDIQKRSKEIKEIYGRVFIPYKHMIQLFLLEKGIDTSQFQKWKDYRNKLTHGEMSLELDDDFINECSSIFRLTRRIVNEYFDRIIIIN